MLHLSLTHTAAHAYFEPSSSWALWGCSLVSAQFIPSVIMNNVAHSIISFSAPSTDDRQTDRQAARGPRQIFCNFYNMSSGAQGVIINVSIIYQSCRKVLSASCSRPKWNMILTVQTVRMSRCLSVCLRIELIFEYIWQNNDSCARVEYTLNTHTQHILRHTHSHLRQAEQKWLVVCALKYAMKNGNYFYF